MGMYYYPIYGGDIITCVSARVMSSTRVSNNEYGYYINLSSNYEVTRKGDGI
jgi:hypothetical protein